MLLPKSRCFGESIQRLPKTYAEPGTIFSRREFGVYRLIEVDLPKRIDRVELFRLEVEVGNDGEKET